MTSTSVNSGNNVVTLILNYNNGLDTIECLESLRDEAGIFYTEVVLCDNASTDNSIEFVKSWATKNSISINVYSYLVAKEGGIFKSDERNTEHNSTSLITLIHTGGNLGFAGGCNVGIRYALLHIYFTHILLLNNDAIASETSVDLMVRRMKLDYRIGLCGCTVVYSHTPNCVQALGGGTYNAFLGRCSHVGALSLVSDTPKLQWVENRMDYVLGASMMVTKQFLKDVGLLDERYFLYYEEVDWAIRGKRLGYRLGFTEGAVIYHKEGKSIGSNSKNNKRSLLSEYYISKNRIRITSKFFPYFLPSVIAYSFLRATRFLIKGDTTRFNTIVRAIFGLKEVDGTHLWETPRKK